MNNIKQGELYSSQVLDQGIIERFLHWFRVKHGQDPTAIFTRDRHPATTIMGIPVYTDESVPVNTVWMELPNER